MFITYSWNYIILGSVSQTMNDDIRNDAVGFDGSTFLQFSEERRKMRYIFFINLNKMY